MIKISLEDVISHMGVPVSGDSGKRARSFPESVPNEKSKKSKVEKDSHIWNHRERILQWKYEKEKDYELHS